MDGAGVEGGVVEGLRVALATAVMTNTDCSGPIQQLIELDVPLQQKFLILDFCELLGHNGLTVEGLRKLIMSLNILEKYGRHLLKPPEARSNMWRHIKYNNSNFRDRVDTIEGGRKIMQQLGYTVNRADGVAFPDGAEPVESHVLQVVADILLGKKELVVYLDGGHPHPGYIEGFLHPKLLDVLKPPSSTATSGPQQRARPTPRPAPSPDTRPPADPGRISEAATPGPATGISGQSPDDRTATPRPDIYIVNISVRELMEKVERNEVTLTKPMIAQLRDRFVSMSTDEKREYYKCADDFLISEEIPSWQDTAQTDNEGASDVVFEPDALLNSKVALWFGDPTRLELDVLAVDAWSSPLRLKIRPQAAGPLVLGELDTPQDRLDAKEIAVTSGYRLPAKLRLKISPTAAGPLVLGELDTLQDRLDTKEIAVTSGYCLPAKYVYHIPTIAGIETEQRYMYHIRQFTNVLDSMKDHGYRTLVDKIVFCVDSYYDDNLHGMVKKIMHNVFPVCHTSVPKSPTLPAEILRMDNKSIDLYKKALSEGETSGHSIRVMVVGHYGGGKTTLTKRLLGEDVDLDARDSTNGIDVHVRRCRVSLADQKWTVLKKDEKVDNVSRRLAQILANQSISDTTEDMMVETARTSADAEGLHEVTLPKTVDDADAEGLHDVTVHKTVDGADAESLREVTTPKTVDDDTANTDVVPTNDTIPKTPVEDDVTDKSVEGDTEKKAIIKDLKELKGLISNSSKSKDNDYADVSFWDFGGQSVFYTTHQTFLSSRAVYLLVTDISKHINDVVGEDNCYFDITGAESCKIVDFINHWLNSVHAHCPLDKEGLPPIILVATHADKLDQGRRKELEEKYFEAVRNTFDGKVTSKHVVDADFAIDNAIVDPNIAALQQKIYEVASKQDYWGERIPANWLTVERALGELCNEELKIITRGKLQEVNNSMHVPIATEESLDLFLQFQHDTANILYFNEAGLRDNIVLDPLWLVDSMKSLITAKNFCSKKPHISSKWNELNRKGILTQELIEAVWTQEELKTSWDHKDHLLQLMQKLNIISKMDGQTHDDCYLVPCMLKEAPPILRKDDCILTQKLCIKTKDGILPAVMFHGLVAGCVSKWPISRQMNKNLIYCGYACFAIGDVHRMTLYFSAGTIQMWVSCYSEETPDPNPDLCAEVREYVLQTLQKINNNLSLSQYSNLELSIKCPRKGVYELDGMFNIDDLVRHNEIICHAHEESHPVRSSEMLRHWYGGDIGRDSLMSPYTWEKILTDKQLSNIAADIGKENERLGLELGLTQGDIDQIKLNNPYDVVNQTTQMLLSWKERVGCKATFRVLERAMVTVGIDRATALAGISGMEEAHRSILCRHRTDIIKNVANPLDVVEGLFVRDIFTESMKQEVEAELTPIEQVEKILYILPHRGPKAFDAFSHVLLETKTEWLVDSMRPGWKDTKPSPDVGLPGERGLAIQQPAVDLPEDWPNEEAMTAQVTVDPCGVHSQLVKDYWNSPTVYSMKKCRRGRCVILSNQVFSGPLEKVDGVWQVVLPTRHGTDKDVDNLVELFKQLHFDVVDPHVDKTAEHMSTVLRDEALHPSHTDAECFVCIICSHGTTTGIYGTDGEVIPLETIISLFDGKNCPALRSKPKLIFIQACHGEEKDKLVETIESLLPQVENLNVGDTRHEADNIPTKADMLVAHATHPGYISIRHTQFGSWFIQAVIYVFKRHAHTEDILSLLTLVNNLVARGITDDNIMQAPVFRASLLKKLYFFPGVMQAPDENVDNVSRRLVQVLAKQSISDTTEKMTVETASTSADADGLHDVTVPKTVDDADAESLREATAPKTVDDDNTNTEENTNRKTTEQHRC